MSHGVEATMQQRNPDEDLYYENVEIGRAVAFGRTVVTAEEIIEFARAFDPQPFHLSEEGAKGSMVGRLCASGFHTCVLLMRMLAVELNSKGKPLGSPGLDEVRWMKPVFPGDELTGRYTCKEKRVMRSRPGVGICRILFELLNQDGDVVMSWEGHQFLSLRPREVRP
jgi:acyl dehydratase